MVSPGKLGYESPTPSTRALDSQTGAVAFCGLQVNKTLLCVTSHFVNMSNQGCDSLLIPKP
jgi:hypothetical protein